MLTSYLYYTFVVVRKRFSRLSCALKLALILLMVV